MKCGICMGEGVLYECKSYLQMQNHKNKIHGEQNEMARFDSVKAYQSQLGGRKERERNADEKLHEAIERWKHGR